MSARTRALVAWAVAIAVLVAAVVLVGAARGDDIAKTPGGPMTKPHTFYGIDPTPQEDDPGWNCLTMGNRTCGATGGEPR